MRVIVIGGGAAGMMAAIFAAKSGNTVTLLEKKSSLGNKLKITGKGRCNLTFDGDIEDFKNNIVKNYKFMYSSFSNFTNKDTIEYFNNLGITTKIERGGRVFPQSDNANDIVNALQKELKKNNVKTIYNSQVEEIITKDNRVVAVSLKDKSRLPADKIILATGGKSYTSTGSTGDGYILAQKLGHNIVELKPALVPLKSNNRICKELQGLSLKNVLVTLLDSTNNKEIYKEQGEMMFSHFGVTGPVILSASSRLNQVKDVTTKLMKNNIKLIIDLKPALDSETLDKRICRDFSKYTNKEFKNSLDDLLPQKLIPVVISMSGINKDKKVHQITKEERVRLVEVIKHIEIIINDFMPLDIAIVTSGGIDVKEVNPKNMESKIVSGLHFAGEILDVDAYTGGYNLQIAFSTAVAAGK